MKFWMLLIKETWSEYGRHNAGWLAAALAYYTAFAIAPLILVITAVASLFLGSNHHILAVTLAYLARDTGPGSAAVQQLVTSMVSEPKTGFVAASIGWVVFLIAALGLIQALQSALNTIWGFGPPKMSIVQMLGQRGRSLMHVMGIALFLVVAIILDGSIAIASGYFATFLPGLPVLGTIFGLAASFAVLWLGFSLVFYFIPEGHVEWEDVRIGAAFTALCFVLAQFVLALYLSHAATSSSFGALGSFVLFLLWVNYSAQTMLFGAEFTQVYARRHNASVPMTGNPPQA